MNFHSLLSSLTQRIPRQGNKFDFHFPIGFWMKWTNLPRYRLFSVQGCQFYKTFYLLQNFPQNIEFGIAYLEAIQNFLIYKTLSSILYYCNIFSNWVLPLHWSSFLWSIRNQELRWKGSWQFHSFTLVYSVRALYSCQQLS